MGLKGDTRSMPLANVLQDLATNEQTGTLRIRSRDRAVALWFERGALRLVGLGPGEGPSILNGLFALGKLRPEDLPPAAGRRTSEHSLLRTLAKKGRVAPDDLKAALEHQMAEHLCDAFLWPDAQFEFDEGDPDDRLVDADQLDLEPRIPVDAVIFEAVRRADEWAEARKVILSPDEIFTADPRRAPADADATTRRLLPALNGERSLREVQELTRLGQFVVYRAVWRLVKEGAARPLAPAEAVERARALASRREWDATLKMARYGLAHERSNPHLLELALRAAETIEDHETAAGYGRQLASVQVESGQTEAALASYQKVLAHAPRDLTAHERMVDLFLRLGRKLEALTAGEALASAYKKAGLPDKALEVYRLLVDKVGDQPDLLESLAEIQRRLGDKREAVWLYRKLLSRSLEARDDEAALDYCRTILRIDPAHEEALRVRRQIESGQIEKSRRRRRRLKLLVVIGALLVAVAAAAAYEWQARHEHEMIRAKLRNVTLDRRYRDALGLYDRVIESWPWSLIAHQLRPDREGIEERFVKEELDSAATLDALGQVPEALKTVEGTVELARREDHRQTLAREIDRLRHRRRVEEEKWDRDLKGKTPEQIGQVRDPLAVPAIEKLLFAGAAPSGAGGLADVPRAALAALGAIEGEAATEALIKALADPDAAVRSEAAAHLSRRTGQQFGPDSKIWQKWWMQSGRSKGTRPLLQAILSAAKTDFAPREAVPVEWRLANLGSAEIEFEMEARPERHLRIVPQPTSPNGSQGQPRTGAGESPAAGSTGPRPVRLAPGEFLGGTFDPTPHLDKPGRYRLLWTAPVRWNGKPLPIEAIPLVLERKP